MRNRNRSKKQGARQCVVCGWDVPRKGPHKDHCSIDCWAKDNGEDRPEETNDKIVPFEGFRVGS